METNFLVKKHLPIFWCINLELSIPGWGFKSRHEVLLKELRDQKERPQQQNQNTLTNHSTRQQPEQLGNIHPCGTKAVIFPLETALVSISIEVSIIPPVRMDTSSCWPDTWEMGMWSAVRYGRLQERLQFGCAHDSRIAMISSPRLPASGKRYVGQDH